MSYRKYLMPSISPSEMYEATAVDSDTDTISRQAAKDMIKNHRSDFSTEKDYRTARACVNALPPAEPKKGVIEQIKWERDVALEQLKELGYGLGEKIRAEKDCISRQAAIDYFVINVGFHDEDGYPIEDTDELRKIWTEYFDGIPPVEPKRIRGRWITDKQGFVTWSPICNKCGKRTEMVGGYYNFCPHCGADMREVTE